jgi:hypothetical protein
MNFEPSNSAHRAISDCLLLWCNLLRQRPGCADLLRPAKRLAPGSLLYRRPDKRAFTDGAGGFLPGVPLGLGCLGMAPVIVAQSAQIIFYLDEPIAQGSVLTVGGTRLSPPPFCGRRSRKPRLYAGAFVLSSLDRDRDSRNEGIEREVVAMAKSYRMWGAVVPLLLLSSPAYSQSKSTSYSCVAEFAGGGSYNSFTKHWEGGSINLNSDSSQFILRVTHLGSRIDKRLSFPRQFDNYNVSITLLGSKYSLDCKANDNSKIVSTQFGIIKCNAVFDFVYNTGIGRFVQVSTFGYVRGSNDDTPYIFGGTCTKIG